MSIVLGLLTESSTRVQQYFFYKFRIKIGFENSAYLSKNILLDQPPLAFATKAVYVLKN